MAPKDKAIELSMKFDREGETDNAIKCALICVDEIIKFQPWDVYTWEQSKAATEYWNEVKLELNKL